MVQHHNTGFKTDFKKGFKTVTMAAYRELKCGLTSTVLYDLDLET